MICVGLEGAGRGWDEGVVTIQNPKVTPLPIFEKV